MSLQSDIDQKNANFWNELCGTGLAMEAGLNDRSPESLLRYDQLYFGYYPYLKEVVGTKTLKQRKVLEIGLGYGTLGREISASGAEYSGLDISKGPVDMINYSLELCGLQGKAVQGSAIDNPFPNNTFDNVVSIGCLHHTGNFEKAVSECHRVLKTGGTFNFMVYNKYSFRLWSRWPSVTFSRLMAELKSASRIGSSAEERGAYDQSVENQGVAPHTDFFSKSELKDILSSAGFKDIQIKKRNMDPLARHGRLLITRENMRRLFEKLGGLDLYVSCKK